MEGTVSDTAKQPPNTIKKSSFDNYKIKLPALYPPQVIKPHHIPASQQEILPRSNHAKALYSEMPPTEDNNSSNNKR
eukprot:15330064-Ditylum_brightwellii.AAC.2